MIVKVQILTRKKVTVFLNEPTANLQFNQKLTLLKWT